MQRFDRTLVTDAQPVPFRDRAFNYKQRHLMATFKPRVRRSTYYQRYSRLAEFFDSRSTRDQDAVKEKYSRSQAVFVNFFPELVKNFYYFHLPQTIQEQL